MSEHDPVRELGSMIKVVLSPDAIVDYDESFAWYVQRSRRAAQGFEDEAASAIDRIANEHSSCPHFDEVYQYTRLNRYPFLIVFRADDDTAHVLAIAHSSRVSGYWKGRDSK